MQKRIITLALTLACLAFALSASAETFKGGSVTLEIPDGWKSMYNEPTLQAMAASPDESCVVSIQVLPTNGQTSESFAALLSKEMNGETPKQTENGKAYSFSAVTSGTPVLVTAASAGAKSVVFVEIGDKEKYAKEVKLVRNSLHSDDPAEQELLDTLK